MTERERKDLFPILRSAVDVYQAELQRAKLRLEKQSKRYISEIMAYHEAVELYEKRMKAVIELCEEQNLSEFEKKALEKWKE